MTRIVPIQAVLCAAVLLAVASSPSRAASISISCGALGAELEQCRIGAKAWAEEAGHTVSVVSTPNSSSDRLALYQQILAARGGDIDVYQIDVVWPGLLGSNFVDLTPYLEGAQAAHFPALVENDTVDGELKAMPWFVDAGLLYYRADLLEAHGARPPQTWAELAETAGTVMQAERAAGNAGMWGFVFQGRAYEGLTCNALEWIASFGGGTIIDDAGEITVDNPAAVTALEAAAGWMEGIAPEGVLNYAEEETRGVFQSGNAVFMRNWPYAWALANSADSPVAGKVGVTMLPKGGADGTHTATLGGQQLAVSRYSDHPEIAVDLVRYLTSRKEQKRRAIEASYHPTIVDLYDDAEVLAAAPFFGELFETFRTAVARPSRQTGEKYNRVSNAFYNAVHRVLTGRSEPAESLDDLGRELVRVRRRGW